MKINDIIRTRRQALGLTQEGLADKLGVSAPAVNKWERGLNYPDITLHPILARTLGVDLNTLLSFQEDMSRESRRNIEIMWLLRGLKPDHKTIARFRQYNAVGLKNVFHAFVRLCSSLDLYGKEMVVVDGSKFKAWNSKDRNFTKGKVGDRLRNVEEKIKAYLDELERQDNLEDQEMQRTAAATKSILAQLEQRKARLEAYKEELDNGEETQISLTDADSRLMKTKDGMEVCLNVQTVVDSKNKMVVEFSVLHKFTDFSFAYLYSLPMQQPLDSPGTQSLPAFVDNG